MEIVLFRVLNPLGKPKKKRFEICDLKNTFVL